MNCSPLKGCVALVLLILAGCNQEQIRCVRANVGQVQDLCRTANNPQDCVRDQLKNICEEIAPIKNQITPENQSQYRGSSGALPTKEIVDLFFALDARIQEQIVTQYPEIEALIAGPTDLD